MKLDELLSEYADSLASARPALPPLEELVRPRPRRPAYGWWAAAAAALFLVWSAVPARQPRPLVRAKVPVPQAVAPVSAPVLAARRPAVARRTKPVVRPAVESPFVPLAENSMLPEPAFLQMVRVSVRRERLAELGIATRATATADALVNADVLLGDDGIARALRLVHSE
jgi:hypothetical protein